MNRTIILGMVALTVSLLLTGCSINKYKDTDAYKFKTEYEMLNGKKNDNGQTIRSIEIDKDNPIIYSTADEIVEMMDNNETFAVYFGFSKCPWCRSVLPTMFEVSNYLNIDKIYYVDVLDIRNTLEVNKDGEVVESKKGSKAYYKLLEKFDEVLDDYTLKDSDGNIVESNQKRIYAPNIVSVVAGEAQELTTGISDMQEDPYEELTKEMKKEMYSKIKCTLDCLSKTNGVCVKNAC